MTHAAPLDLAPPASPAAPTPIPGAAAVRMPVSKFAADRWRPNTTVAAIIERDGRFLLVEEDTADGLRLNNPAGHLDPGEAPETACVREVLEETKHRFTATALVGVYLSRFTKTSTGEDVTYLRFAYTGELGDEVPGAEFDEGIVRTLWMSYEEIVASADRHRTPLLLRGIDDYLTGRRYPLDVVHADPSILQTPAQG
ncbi:MAG: Phosphatase NudJ [Paracidovorax wautersii]|uniref:Phosphatase NudJ n=1 Tax=Paracidovorax wautersii TaxID=1177982 RepID=A0A7V8FNQ6_9BURK|nr:MAG: Phosphatase NudJ [Paracidovorax wautersii]